MATENTEFEEGTPVLHFELLPDPILRLLPTSILFLLVWVITITVRLVRKENKSLLRKHREMKCLMSIDDVAEVLDVSRRTTEDIVATGELDPIWIRGQRRFHPDAVEAYVRNRAREDK